MESSCSRRGKFKFLLNLHAHLCFAPERGNMFEDSGPQKQGRSLPEVASLSASNAHLLQHSFWLESSAQLSTWPAARRAESRLSGLVAASRSCWLAVDSQFIVVLSCGVAVSSPLGWRGACSRDTERVNAQMVSGCFSECDMS